jgi:hypothetical protein
MPYEISFTKPVTVADDGQYIDDCCVGGDVVLDQLQPALREQYGDLQINQEDWGWVGWFEQSGIRFAVDVVRDEGSGDDFRMYLTSLKPRLLLQARIQDTPELEALREMVVAALNAWQVAQLKVKRVDEKHI